MNARTIKVSIDSELCMGAGICRDSAPAAFRADDSGQSVVDRPDEASRESVIEAMEMCPAGAIAVVDAETDEPLDE